MQDKDRTSIPEWMLTQEIYEPENDRDGFITRSVLQVMSLLTDIRENTAINTKGASATMKLLYTLLFIILSAGSRNMMFTYILLAGLLVRIMILPEKLLKGVFRGAISVTGLTVIFMLPSVFLGSPRTLLTVSLKVFLSVGLINLMPMTTPWNKLTEALKVFHVPDMFIFIFDITLKYIAILGDLCYKMLTALRCRSVGRNRNKRNAFSGILGAVFLKSREMSEEMYGAMVCRGFEGEYHKRKKNPFKKEDIAYAVLCAAVTALFIYLQRGMMR